MVNLAQKISFLFPNAVSLVDFAVSNDGTGEVISFWSPALGAQPSQATLDAVTQAQIDAANVAAADAAEPLLADLLSQADGAISTNDTYIGLASPTNAQVAAQVRALTQQNQRVIKVMRRIIRRNQRGWLIGF